MDSSRFKRRETQTRRQITTDIRGYSSARPIRSTSLDFAARTGQAAQPVLQPMAPAPIQSTSLPSPSSVTRPINTIAPIQPAPPLQPMPPLQLKPVAQVAASPIAQTSPVQPLAIKPAQTSSPEAADTANSGLPARRLPISMEVPGEPSPEKPAVVKVLQSRWKATRHWAFRSTAVVLVLVIALSGVMFSQGWLKARKVFKGGTTSAAALNANVAPSLLKGEGDGRINILLLGRGGGNHDAPDLTDTIILASIDPVNHTSTLLSVPRDFWVKTPGGSASKINAVWANAKYKHLGKATSDNSNPKATLAGFTAIDQTIESVIGVPIHYNVIIDFNAFKQAVDTVGGITVNVPTDLVDPTMAWDNGRDPVLARAGVQEFDGKKALNYSRSRQTSNDFARSERQRAVLMALKDKVNTSGTLSSPAKLSSLANVFGNNVQTDLSISDAARLANIMKNIDNTKVNSIGLADSPNNFITTANIGGQSVVQPKDGLFDYTAIQNFVRGQLKDPFLEKEQANIKVYNGTTVPGLAGSQSEVLKSYGYTITGTGNAPTQGYSQTVIVDLTAGKSKYTKRYLEQRYGVTAVTSLPDPAVLPNGADFVIIVGNDSTTINQG